MKFGSNRDAIRAGIAYLLRRPSVTRAQPAAIDCDNLIMASLDKLLVGGLISPSKKATVVKNWIGSLASRSASGRPDPHAVRRHNQQRVAIAKWLAIGPEILILDAPTVGVDVGARAGIFEIVRKLGLKASPSS